MENKKYYIQFDELQKIAYTIEANIYQHVWESSEVCFPLERDMNQGGMFKGFSVNNILLPSEKSYANMMKTLTFANAGAMYGNIGHMT